MENAMSGSTSSVRCNISHTRGWSLAKFIWLKTKWYIAWGKQIPERPIWAACSSWFFWRCSCVRYQKPLDQQQHRAPIQGSGWARTPQSAAQWSVCSLAAIHNFQSFPGPQKGWYLGLCRTGTRHSWNNLKEFDLSVHTEVYIKI